MSTSPTSRQSRATSTATACRGSRRPPGRSRRDDAGGVPLGRPVGRRAHLFVAAAIVRRSHDAAQRLESRVEPE
jgi:hypothetical protein